jgi:hypothetical protein
VMSWPVPTLINGGPKRPGGQQAGSHARNPHDRARNTPAGSRSIRLSSTRAGPCGFRSPRSQCRSVATDTPNRAANCACVKPKRPRTAATSTVAGRHTFTPDCSPAAWPMASAKPCRMLLKALPIMSPFKPNSCQHLDQLGQLIALGLAQVRPRHDRLGFEVRIGHLQALRQRRACRPTGAPEPADVPSGCAACRRVCWCRKRSHCGAAWDSSTSFHQPFEKTLRIGGKFIKA